MGAGERWGRTGKNPQRERKEREGEVMKRRVTGESERELDSCQNIEHADLYSFKDLVISIKLGLLGRFESGLIGERVQSERRALRAAPLVRVKAKFTVKLPDMTVFGDNIRRFSL